MLTRNEYQKKIRLYRHELTARLDRVRARSVQLGERAVQRVGAEAGRLRELRRQAAPAAATVARTTRESWSRARQGTARAYGATKDAVQRSVGPLWANRSRYVAAARKELGEQADRLRTVGRRIAPKIAAAGKSGGELARRLGQASVRSYETAAELTQKSLRRLRRSAAQAKPAASGAATQPEAEPATQPRQPAKAPAVKAPAVKAKTGRKPAKRKAPAKPAKKRAVAKKGGKAATVAMKTGKKSPAGKRTAAKKTTAGRAKPAKKTAPQAAPAKKAAG